MKPIKRDFYSASQLQVRALEEGKDSRTIEGYAILFNNRSAPLYEDDEEVVFEEISDTAITTDFLNACDIRFNMFHNNNFLLARSKEGSGTLSYKVDEKGVFFSFEAPNTIYGDNALELVKRRDIQGCSFAFTTYYYDEDFVEHLRTAIDNKITHIYRIKKMLGIYDFTLTQIPQHKLGIYCRTLNKQNKLGIKH